MTASNGYGVLDAMEEARARLGSMASDLTSMTDRHGVPACLDRAQRLDAAVEAVTDLIIQARFADAQLAREGYHENDPPRSDLRAAIACCIELPS